MDETAWTWKRKLKDFLSASDAGLIKLLRADRLLHDWTGSTCPRCQKGNSGMPRHRCNGFGCQAYINPHHLHPLFVDARGSSHTSLPTQSALLFLLLNRVPNATIHRILHINHKAIEDMDKRMMQLRKAWVEEKEKLIAFGNGKTWMNIEADEATFTTTDFKDCAEDPAKPVAWEQWCGIIQRGCPQTLLLKRLSPTTRSPGPGAIRKVEWKPLATKHLQDRCVVLHTDAAKSYRLRLPGILHDHVKHCKKRIKVKGKWVWKPPTYVKLITHKDPKSGLPIKTKGGTQIIDRAWRYLKDRIKLNQNCTVGSPLMRIKIRSAQYEYWHRNADLWLACGTLCSWHMAKI